MSSKKQKVLYIITKSQWGGAQRYVYDLATNLPKSYFDVTVACGGEGVLVEKLKDTNIRVIPLPFLQRDVAVVKELGVFWHLLKVLKQERPHIVHLNSSKIGGLGGLAVRTHNLLQKLRTLQSTDYSLQSKAIFTAHGWAFHEQRPQWQNILIRILSWVTVLLSHQTIVVSEYDTESAHWMPFVQHKLTTIHNGISVPVFLARDAARAELIKYCPKLEHTKPTLWIGTIAELHPNKGLMYGLQAFEDMPKNVSWIIIGEGEKRAILEKEITLRGLEKQVFLPGTIANASRLLSACDIFVLPSVKEGLPYVLLEAGSAGVATIATAVGGIPEIIDDMESGILVKSRKSDELHRALMFLLEHKEKRVLFGKALKKKIAAQFSLRHMLSHTRALYTTLTTER